MIENTDAEQIERLNSRIVELLRERDAMRAALKDYEQWEADLIMENKCWEGREVPQLTGDLWDRLIELQAMRNAALGAKP